MTFNKNLLTATLLTVAGLTAVSSANADTVDGAFDVKLAITEICSVTSASGTQDINLQSFAAGADVTEASSGTDISVNCSNTTGYSIGLFGSGFLTDSVSDNTVAYSLLKTTGGAVWGNTGTDLVTGEGTGMAADQAKKHKVFASLAAGSTNNLTAGNYTDTVAVTVTY